MNEILSIYLRRKGGAFYQYKTTPINFDNLILISVSLQRNVLCYYTDNILYLNYYQQWYEQSLNEK